MVPREYARNPAVFGTGVQVEFQLPAGGCPHEMARAELLHDLFGALGRLDGLPSGAEIGRRHGFSRSTWSAASAGKRWPPATMVLAVVLLLHAGDYLSLSDTFRQRLAYPHGTSKVKIERTSVGVARLRAGLAARFIFHPRAESRHDGRTDERVRSNGSSVP